MQISYTLSTIEAAADKLWQSGHQHRVWCFSGDMGAGKTTLIATLCKLLKTTDAISSPTFSLINEYHFVDEAGRDKIIYHMDLYRMEGVAEAMNAGVEEALDTGDLCLVEWAEKAPELFGNSTYHIYIKSVGDEQRELTVKLGFAF